MAEKRGYVRKETLLLFCFAALIVGFVGGVFYSAYKNPPATPGLPQVPAGPSEEIPDRIAALKKLVSLDSEDVEAWIELGNVHFDAGQPKDAIAAYDRALELRPDNPNVWTDLGVMYRRSGEPEKAAQAFRKASELDPLHEPSRFNLGVVLMHDLDDRQGAQKAWENLVQLNPMAQAPGGQSVLEILEMLKKQ